MATPALAPQPYVKENRKNIAPVLVGCGAVLAGAAFVSLRNWGALPMSVSLQNVGTLLAPIAFASAVVERSVEILISPWRDARANNLENEIAAIKSRAPSSGVMAQDDQDRLKAKSEELAAYRGETQRLAFAASMILSAFVSIAGIRAFGPFLAASAFSNGGIAQSGQEGFFYFVDVGLTATVLAGGATGVHSIVNAITTFFDSTANKAQTS